MPQQNGRPGVVVLGSDFKGLGVIRSLGQRGIPCALIDNLPRSAWFSRYVTKRFKWNGPLDTDDFLQFLLSIGKEHHLTGWVLFPVQDDAVELVTHHVSQLATSYQLVTQKWDVVRWAHDKRLTYQLAQEAGVPYPKTWYPNSEDQLKTLDITFPVIIKPAVSIHFQHALRLKALPVYSLDELIEQYHLTAKIIPPEEIMIQEIIPGDGRTQYSVGTFCKNGEVVQSITARRTRQYPIDYGLGSSFVEAIEVPVIGELAEKLLCMMGVSGMVEVEFKYDMRDEQYKLLDINVRPWGWHTLCIECGLDLPYIQYCDALGYEIPAPIKPQYGRHWVRMLTDLPAGIQEIRAGMTTPIAYIHSLLGKTAFSVFAWHDPLPALGDLGVAFSRLTKMLSHQPKGNSQ
jgi:predicted ATP-grasp superfamily ATP-dependent carboligase